MSKIGYVAFLSVLLLWILHFFVIFPVSAFS